MKTVLLYKPEQFEEEHLTVFFGEQFGSFAFQNPFCPAFTVMCTY